MECLASVKLAVMLRAESANVERLRVVLMMQVFGSSLAHLNDAAPAIDAPYRGSIVRTPASFDLLRVSSPVPRIGFGLGALSGRGCMIGTDRC